MKNICFYPLHSAPSSEEEYVTLESQADRDLSLPDIWQPVPQAWAADLDRKNKYHRNTLWRSDGQLNVLYNGAAPCTRHKRMDVAAGIGIDAS